MSISSPLYSHATTSSPCSFSGLLAEILSEFFFVIILTPLYFSLDNTLTLLRLSEKFFLSITRSELSPVGITCSQSGNLPSINLLTNFVPAASTKIDDCEILIRTFSELSPTNFPISLIDFLGTIPSVVSIDASLRVEEAKASLWASVATDVIFLSSIDMNKPFK